MKKRILLCSALVCIVATMFCGCGKSDSDKTIVPEKFVGSYYRDVNKQDTYYIKIYSGGRVECKNVMIGYRLSGHTAFLTGKGTGTAELFNQTTNDAYYRLTMHTTDYKIRNYRGELLKDGTEWCELFGEEDVFTTAMNRECNKITQNAIAYKKYKK